MNLPLIARIRRGALLLLAYWLLLFIATHTPKSRLPLSLNIWDKAGHFGAYMLLAILVFAVVARRRWSWSARCWSVFGGLVVYGAIDEWLQGFIPGRQPDLLDFSANVLGIATGIAVYSVVVARFTQRSTAKTIRNSASADDSGPG